MKVLYLLLLLAICANALPSKSKPEPESQSDESSKEASEEESGTPYDEMSRASLPKYAEAKRLVDEVERKLKSHVLSIPKDPSPLLNNLKRHYAEIIYVVLSTASTRTGCLFIPYYENYQKHINEFAPEALSEPQKVVDAVQKLIDDFNEKTKKIQDTINECSDSDLECDRSVDDAIEDASDLSKEAQILLTGAKAAKVFLHKHRQFLEVSDNLVAHQYVIKGARKLKDTVYAVAELLKALKPVPGQDEKAC